MTSDGLLWGECDLLFMAFPLIVTLAWLRFVGDLEGTSSALVITTPLVLGYDLDHASIGRLCCFRITLFGETLALVVDDGRATRIQSANATSWEHAGMERTIG
jgi:hypothetical protein